MSARDAALGGLGRPRASRSARRWWGSTSGEGHRELLRRGPSLVMLLLWVKLLGGSSPSGRRSPASTRLRATGSSRGVSGRSPNGVHPRHARAVRTFPVAGGVRARCASTQRRTDVPTLCGHRAYRRSSTRAAPRAVGARLRRDPPSSGWPPAGALRRRRGARRRLREPVVGAVRAEARLVFRPPDGGCRAGATTFAGLPATSCSTSRDAFGGATGRDGRRRRRRGAHQRRRRGLRRRPHSRIMPAASAVRRTAPRRAVLLTGEVYATTDGGATWRHAGASIRARAGAPGRRGRASSRRFGTRALAFLPDGRLVRRRRASPEALTRRSPTPKGVRRRSHPAGAPAAQPGLWRTGYIALLDGGASSTSLRASSNLPRTEPGAPSTRARSPRDARPRAPRRRPRPEALQRRPSPSRPPSPTGFDVLPRLRLGRAGGRVREVVLSQRVAPRGLTADRAWGWRDDRRSSRRPFASTPRRVLSTTGARSRATTDDTCAFTPDGALLMLDRGRASTRDVRWPRGTRAARGSRIAFHDDQRGMAYGERVDRGNSRRTAAGGGRRWRRTAPRVRRRRASCHAGGCSWAA